MMMKKATGIFVFSLLFLHTYSQDATIRKLQTESLRSIQKDFPDSLPRNWKTGAVYTISIGQGSQSNWAAGGDDFSLSVSTSLNLFTFFKKGKSSWDNIMNLNFGYIKTTSLGGRKNDDRLDIVSKYGYALNSKLNLTSLTNFRSQMLNGYTYNETGKNTFAKNFSSAFLSPAYLLISQGLDYKPVKCLSVFLSPITSRWVIVNNDSLASKGDYGLEPGKHSNNELGAFATINYFTSFNKFISYRGRIDLFSNYKRNPLNTDLYMTNSISAKLGKVICLSWNVDMIYDDDVKLFGKDGSSPALQLKSIFGVGLQVRI